HLGRPVPGLVHFLPDIENRARCLAARPGNDALLKIRREHLETGGLARIAGGLSEIRDRQRARTTAECSSCHWDLPGWIGSRGALISQARSGGVALRISSGKRYLQLELRSNCPPSVNPIEVPIPGRSAVPMAALRR